MLGVGGKPGSVESLKVHCDLHVLQLPNIEVEPRPARSHPKNMWLADCIKLCPANTRSPRLRNALRPG